MSHLRSVFIHTLYLLGFTCFTSLILVAEGNAQSLPVKQTHYIDSTSLPGVHVVLSGPNARDGKWLVVGKNTRIQLRPAKFNRNPIWYQLDDTVSVNYVSPFTVARGGNHRLTIRSADEQDGESSKSIYFSVDSIAPVISGSIVYKSVTLHRFHWTESAAQSETILVECPVGAELHLMMRDDVTESNNVFLREGPAAFKPLNGAISLRARGRHQYRIVAWDLLGNVTESPLILLEIIEP